MKLKKALTWPYFYFFSKLSLVWSGRLAYFSEATQRLQRHKIKSREGHLYRSFSISHPVHSIAKTFQWHHILGGRKIACLLLWHFRDLPREGVQRALSPLGRGESRIIPCFSMLLCKSGEEVGGNWGPLFFSTYHSVAHRRGSQMGKISNRKKAQQKLLKARIQFFKKKVSLMTRHALILINH